MRRTRKENTEIYNMQLNLVGVETLFCRSKYDLKQKR